MSVSDKILDLLALGATPWEVAETLVDQDVSAGEYEGCSSDLEMAFGEYKAQAERVLREVTP